MDRIFEQFDFMLERYSKVFVVRYDLHPKKYSSNNKEMSDYMKELIRTLKQKYKCDIGYAWAREMGWGNNHHYHLLLMLNGHKINFPDSLSTQVSNLWKDHNNGHVYIPEHCYYMAKRWCSEISQQIIYRSSYLAKKDTKGRRDNQAKDYQTSRLKSKYMNLECCYLTEQEIEA